MLAVNGKVRGNTKKKGTMLERESNSDSVIKYTSDKYDGRFNGSILKNLSKGLALHSPSSSATTNLSNVNLKPLSSGEL